MRGRIRRLALLAAVLTATTGSGDAHAINGSVNRFLHYESANRYTFWSNPYRDSPHGSWGTGNNCDNAAYKIEVNVYVVKFAPGKAKVRTIQLIMDHPAKDYWLAYASTAYWDPADGKLKSGPNLSSRTFYSGYETAHVLPFGDRWVSLDKSTKAVQLRWTILSEDDSDMYCGVTIHAHFYKGEPPSGGGGGGGCAEATYPATVPVEPDDPADPGKDQLANAVGLVDTAAVMLTGSSVTGAGPVVAAGTGPLGELDRGPGGDIVRASTHPLGEIVPLDPAEPCP